MILFPREVLEFRSPLPARQPPPPVKKKLKRKDHSYNKWTQVRLHQDSNLKSCEENGTHPYPHCTNW